MFNPRTDLAMESFSASGKTDLPGVEVRQWEQSEITLTEVVITDANTASQLGIRHKLIRPYTPRHNGKVERSHREDQKRFYSCHSFFSLLDFQKQLALHNRRSNNFPMRPLYWLSPAEFIVQYL